MPVSYPTSGEVTVSGLKVAIKITTMTVGDTETALPATSLTDRNSLSIVNFSATEKLYLGPTGITADRVNGTTSGWEVGPDETFNVDVTDDIVLYGICESGKSVQIKVMELA